MIEKIKLLVGDPDLPEDVLEIYISRAVSTILSYVNNPRFTKEYILETYEDAVILLVENIYLTKDKKFISRYSQGKRSVTYSDEVFETIPAEVKNLLPSPFIRMM